MAHGSETASNRQGERLLLLTATAESGTNLCDAAAHG